MMVLYLELMRRGDFVRGQMISLIILITDLFMRVEC